MIDKTLSRMRKKRRRDSGAVQFLDFVLREDRNWNCFGPHELTARLAYVDCIARFRMRTRL
jgi:hypothetical protein